MNISAETIQTLYYHYDVLESLQEAASEAIKAAKEHQESRVTIRRDSGEEQEVTEKMLWDEVWNLSGDSEAGRFLRGKYPDAFEKSDAVNKKVMELREFTLGELGIDAQAIKLSDIVRITGALIDYKLNERKSEEKQGTEPRNAG